jgi:SAM-dependent methyltransferase
VGLEESLVPKELSPRQAVGAATRTAATGQALARRCSRVTNNRSTTGNPPACGASYAGTAWGHANRGRRAALRQYQRDAVDHSRRMRVLWQPYRRPMGRNRVPSIEENLYSWNEQYDWRLGGDPWSKWWGSAGAQWYGCNYPRIRGFLPVPAILEIAPGFGRWTEFLVEHCDTFVGVDLAPRCIDACRQRFADQRGASFETDDGHSVPMVADSSVHFAFSFDSLVHVEAPTLGGYLTELARVLRPDGVAFIHRSNYGTYPRFTRAQTLRKGTFDHLPALARAGLRRTVANPNCHGRAASVTAARFAELCEQAGMHCISQELVNWGGGVLLIDSFSVVTHPWSRWDRPNRVVKNQLFRAEARAIRRSGSVYDTLPSRE